MLLLSPLLPSLLPLERGGACWGGVDAACVCEVRDLRQTLYTALTTPAAAPNWRRAGPLTPHKKC